MDELFNYNDDLLVEALQKFNYEELKKISDFFVIKLNEMEDNQDEC